MKNLRKNNKKLSQKNSLYLESKLDTEKPIKYSEIFKNNIYHKENETLPLINEDSIFTYEKSFCDLQKNNSFSLKNKNLEKKLKSKVDLKKIIKDMVPRIQDIKELEKQIQL